MTIPAFNETYVVSVAFVDTFHQPADQLADLLQMLYDGGNVAGFFEWQRLGRVTVLEFERQIGEDTEVLLDLNREMTPETVAKQIADELTEAQGQPDLAQEEGLGAAELVLRNDAYNLATTIIKKLVGEEDVSVKGLLCQMPKVRVTFELAYENKASREYAEQVVILAVKGAAQTMRGEIITHKMEKL